MAKPKKGVMRGGPVKSHGPKRHQFAEYGKALSMEFAKAGITNKYHDRESWRMACIDRGCKSVGQAEWVEFSKLKGIEAKKAWFESIGKKQGK